MESIFSTPGRRSFGDRGRLPECDEFAGLVIADYSVTEWREHVNYPCLGYLTVKGKGKDDATTALFLACQAFYPDDHADLTVVRGVWFSKAKHFFRYHQKRTFTAAQIKQINSLDPDHYLLCPNWKDTGAFALFEKSFKWLRGADDFSDPDAEKIVGAVRLIDGFYAIELWPQDSLHDDLVWAAIDAQAQGWVAAGGSQPRPPLGLTPVGAFNMGVKPGAFFHRQVRRYGIDPTKLIYGETVLIDGEEKSVALWSSPVAADGYIQGFELIGAAAAREIDPLVQGGWLQGNERELVLTDVVVTADQECIVDGGALVIGRDAAQQHLRLEHPKVRAVPCVCVCRPSPELWPARALVVGGG